MDLTGISIDLSSAFNNLIKDAIADAKFPDYEDYVFWRDLAKRIFTISGEIEEYSLQWLIDEINNINIEDANKPKNELKPITIIISSNGGALTDALALCDAIITSRTPVVTVCQDMAYSAAFLIFIAGHKRICYKHSSFLYHEGSGGAAGTYDQVQEANKNYKDLIDSVKNYVVERTHITKQKLGSKKNKDWYINANEAIDFGVADKIAENIGDVFGNVKFKD